MADTIEIVQGTATVVEVAGPTGPQGPAGAAGATGPQGPQGVPGTGLEVLTTQGDILYQGASTGQRLPIGTSGQVLKVAGGVPTWANESGAVSSVSGKTGAVTLDKNDVGLGNVSNAAQVTSVTGTEPIVSSGGTTPAISISAATTSAAGSMSAADKTKLDGIAAGAEVNVQANWTEADSGSDAFILNKPATFAPSAHSSSHASAGSDALAPSDIGAQSLFTTTNYNITGSGSFTLSASRAQIANIENYSGAKTVTLPTSGNQSGDIAVVRANPSIGTLTVAGAVGGSQTIPTTGSRRYVYDGTNWQRDPVYTHEHEAGDITSGTLAYARGGLAADVAAYNGLVKISGGSTSAVTVTSAGEALLDDADAAAQRTTLGLGTAATAATGDFAAASHSHGNLTSDGKLGSTAGLPVVTTTAGAVTTLALGTANQVLRVNSGASGVEFADPAASGVTGAASSASDVFGVSGASITGVDAGAADRLVFWDDSANKLTYLEAGSGLSISGTTLTATATGTIGGSTSTDNAIVRADSTSNTVQESALVIDDATTSTQANVALRNNHSETNSALVLCNKGTGAFIVSPARPDATSSGGNARGASSVCIVPTRNNANQVASGASAVAIGERARSAANNTVAIGTASVASSNSAVAIGVSCSSSSDDALSLGNGSVGSGAYSIAIGNAVTTASGFVSTAIGRAASASQSDTIAIGRSAAASAANATAIGGVSTTASLRSQFATPNFSSVYWSGQTTTNAATILNLDGTATNRFTIAASTALAVDILLVARRATTQDKWLVARRFLGIRRDGSNNTSLIGTVQTLGTDQSAGSPTWTFALTADDTNEALQLEVTGATGETVEWRATAFYRVA